MVSAFGFVRQNPLFVVIVAVGVFGCSYEPDESEGDSETDSSQLSKPKKAPFGSLGGICGKGLAACVSGDVAVRRFQSLPRTSVAFSSEAKGSGTNERRKVMVKMRVPRLVNDHREKNDQLELALAFSDFDQDSQQHRSELVIKRNGAVVGHFSSVNFEPEKEDLRIDLGGWETLMAFTVDASLMNRLFRELQLTSVVQSKPQGNLGCAFSTGGHCAWCWTGKALVLAGISVAGAVGGAAAATAYGTDVAAAIAGVGTVAGVVAGTNISCEKSCKRSECEEEYCKCSDGTQCKDDFERCCRMSGGITTYRGNVYRCIDFGD